MLGFIAIQLYLTTFPITTQKLFTLDIISYTRFYTNSYWCTISRQIHNLRTIYVHFPTSIKSPRFYIINYQSLVTCSISDMSMFCVYVLPNIKHLLLLTHTIHFINRLNTNGVYVSGNHRNLPKTLRYLFRLHILSLEVRIPATEFVSLTSCFESSQWYYYTW